MSNPSRVSWLRWGELGLGGLLGLELLEGVECLVESESGWVRDIQPETQKKREFISTQFKQAGQVCGGWGRGGATVSVCALPLDPSPGLDQRCYEKKLLQNLNEYPQMTSQSHTQHRK